MWFNTITASSLSVVVRHHSVWKWNNIKVASNDKMNENLLYEHRELQVMTVGINKTDNIQ